MGIQINGQTDVISATDGSLTIQGGSLGNVTGGLNVTSGSVGIGTDNASAAKLDVRGSDNPLLKLTQTTSGIARLNIESETNDGYQYAGIGIGSATADTELMWTTLGFDVNVANSVRLRIPSSGDVQVLTGNLVIGTSGKGIDFSATADGSGTTTSELLDDYEEGTWTPQLLCSGVTFSYNYNRGYYVKVGRLVYALWEVSVSSTSGTGAGVSGTGLPFTTGNSASNPNPGGYIQLASTMGDHPTTTEAGGAATTGWNILYRTAANSSFSSLQFSDIQTNSFMRGTQMYFANA